MFKLFKKFSFLLIGLLVVFFVGNQKVEAAGIKESGFTVEIVKAENQTDSSLNFFSNKVTPGQEQDYTFKLTSTSDQEIPIRIVPTVATTNNQGLIVYNSEDAKHDNSLDIDFTKLGPKAMTVKLAPGETRNVTFTAKFPNESFDGIVLGGFSLANENVQGSSSSGVSIKNQFSYAIAALAFENDNVGEHKVEPDLKLNEVKPTAIGGVPTVVANVQNFKSMYILDNSLTIKADIYQGNSNKALHSNTQKKMNFAPHSTLPFAISWGNNAIQPGEYRIHLLATTNGGKKWEFDKKFTITKAEADKINKPNRTLKKDNTWLYILIAVAAVVLLILTFIFLYMLGRRRNKRRQEVFEQEMRKRLAKENGQARPRKKRPAGDRPVRDSEGTKAQATVRRKRPRPDSDIMQEQKRKPVRKQPTNSRRRSEDDSLPPRRRK